MCLRGRTELFGRGDQEPEFTDFEDNLKLTIHNYFGFRSEGTEEREVTFRNLFLSSRSAKSKFIIAKPKWLGFVLLIFALTTGSVGTQAQQPLRKIWRIGYLTSFGVPLER